LLSLGERPVSTHRGVVEGDGAIRRACHKEKGLWNAKSIGGQENGEKKVSRGGGARRGVDMGISLFLKRRPGTREVGRNLEGGQTQN